MKTFPRFALFQIIAVLIVVAGLTKLAVAAEKKDARVTQVIKDVRVLTAKTGGKPASVNDNVQEGQAVRTGVDSRAELTFSDQTLTRLGANTVFSFGAGAKEFDLASGAALLVVPKSAGEVKINTAAATAAVTGFTAMAEYHPQGVYKFIVLEGQACVSSRAKPGEPCTTLRPGDMLVLPPGGTHFTQRRIDIKKLADSSQLIKGFKNKLPNWANKEILHEQNNQQQGGGGNGPGGGYSDPTGSDLVNQAHAVQTPKPAVPQQSPPGIPTRP